MPPIYVDVSVNSRAIKTYAIGRTRGGTSPDEVNTYVVMELPSQHESFEWDHSTTFEHRYGDGIDACIFRAMTALNEKREEPRAKIVPLSRERASVECASCGDVSSISNVTSQCPLCGESWEQE